MEWESLLSSDRPTSVKKSREPGRSHFHKDYDRVVFSGAFRRLGRKTQVHAMSNNDLVRSRLTHSIEVGSVGRTLATMTAEKLQGRLPRGFRSADMGALVQAACLAHDIGNPPFGHRGEDLIRDWVKSNLRQQVSGQLSEQEYLDLAHFEGNAQGFRLLTRSDEYSSGAGLGLTAATLSTMMKYPWSASHIGDKPKFGVYQSELEVMRLVAELTGLKETGDGAWCRHPLSYLVEAADDTCYGLLDLEDGVSVGILEESDVRPLLLQLASIYDLGVDPHASIPQLRGKAMATVITSVVDVFLKHYDALLAGEPLPELIELTGSDVGQHVKAAKKLARDRIFFERNKADREAGFTRKFDLLLSHLFALLPDSCSEPIVPSNPVLKRLKLKLETARGASMYIQAMMIMDFVTSMTDNFVVGLCNQLEFE